MQDPNAQAYPQEWQNELYRNAYTPTPIEDLRNTIPTEE